MVVYLVTLLSLSFSFMLCDGVGDFVRIGVVPLLVIQGLAQSRF